MRLSEAVRRVYRELVVGRSRVRVSLAEAPTLAYPPIFLVGPYRSGTTLLRYVVDSHSRIACPPETDFVAQLRGLIEDERARGGLAAMGFETDHVAAKVRELVGYFFEAYAQSRSKARWADKSPAYVDHLSFLIELFPTARFVLIHRHPLDQTHSHTRGGAFLHPPLEPFTVPGEDLRLAGARYWAAKTAQLRDFARAHPESTTTIRYEDLCREPEATLRPIFESIGERWEASVLEYHRFDHDLGREGGRVSGTRGFHLSSGAYRGWPAEVIASCYRIVEHEMRHLRYEREGD